MDTFLFKAKTQDGRVVSGSLKAKNQNDAVQMLSAKKLQPIFINKKKALLTLGSGGGVAQKDLVIFARQLAFLVDAGVPIMQSLQTIQPMTNSAVLKNVLVGVINQIDSGHSLSEALANYPLVFNNLFYSLVQAGESSGQLNVLLTQLADDLESSDKMKSRVKKALSYPVFILVVGVGILIGLMTFVVPRFASMFESAGSELPAITKMLMMVSDFFVNNLFLVLFMAVVAPIVFFAYLFSGAGRPVKDQLFWILPIMGPLVRKNCLSRFTKTLSYLIASGVSITDSLHNASVASNNLLVERAVRNIIVRVEKGKSIAESLKPEKIFPDLVSRMIAIGEETGKVDATLAKVAEYYEDQVKTSSAAISDMIQPVFIVFIGGLVGFVVIAIYMPIFKLAGTVGGM